MTHAEWRETDVGGSAWERVTGQGKRRVGRRALLAALADAPWSTADVAAARKKKKNATRCRNGQTITVSKRKKKTLQKRSATPGRRVPRTPPCLPASADLQAAVNAARPGAMLMLCAGSRTLTTTVQNSQDLGLTGAGAAQTFSDGGEAVRSAHPDGLTPQKETQGDTNAQLGG